MQAEKDLHANQHPGGIPDDQDRRLPPRSQVHPSQAKKWARAFYRLLVGLFVGLIIAIYIWYFFYFK